MSKKIKMELKNPYTCKKCGSLITEPGINAPCPKCGHRGHYPVEKKEINIKEKRLQIIKNYRFFLKLYNLKKHGYNVKSKKIMRSQVNKEDTEDIFLPIDYIVVKIFPWRLYLRERKLKNKK